MNRRWLVLLVIVVAVSSAIIGYNMLATPRRENVPVRYPTAMHASIIIASSSDLTRPGVGSGCECVRSGSGQEQDPYVISDWIVNSTGDVGLAVAGTKEHILILRVELRDASGSNTGIAINEAENIVIDDCKITGYLNGIYAFDSSGIEVVNSTISGNDDGMQLEASHDNRIINNRLDDNRGIGLFVRGSQNIVTDNSVSRNGFGGVNVDGTAGPANENQIEHNVVSDNEVYGIAMWRGVGNVLRSNTVTSNRKVGIMLTDQSTKNLIESNTVSANSGSGIALIDGSTGNTIQGNVAKANGDGINDFDLYDAVSGNIWKDNTYGTKEPETLG